MSEREKKNDPGEIGYAVSTECVQNGKACGTIRNAGIVDADGKLNGGYTVVTPEEWSAMKQGGYDYEIAVGVIDCHFELYDKQPPIKKHVAVPANAVLFDVIRNIYFYPEMTLSFFQRNFAVVQQRGRSDVSVGVDRKAAELRDPSSHLKIMRKDAGEERQEEERVRICGLENVGNTCFMNSVLQCLYNIDELTNFFLKNKHLKRDPLDEERTRGGCDSREERLNHSREKLTFEYASLIKDMYRGNGSAITPWSFKNTLSMLNPMFKGSSQHDAPEFLSHLLDGIHEYLNAKKVEKLGKKDKRRSSDGAREVPEAQAEREWTEYRKTNESVITDVFMGQLRSTLECKVCHNTSIKHDPSMYLALSIPDTAEYVPVCINFVDNRLPVKTTVQKNTTVGNLKTALKREKEIKGEMIAVEVSGDRVVREIGDKEAVLRKGTFIYEYGSHKKNILFLTLKFSAYYIMQYGLNHPLLVDRTENIYEAIAAKLSPFVKADKRSKGVEWWRERIEVGKQERVDLPVVKVVFTSGSFSDIFEKDFKMENMVRKEDGGGIDLQNCIDFFMRKEDLSDSNAIYCTRCKRKTGATKQMDMVRAPKCLIISLKKFRYTSSGQVNVNTVVSVPVCNFSIAGAVYSLKGVCNHYPIGSGGHYTATVNKCGRWFTCNDSSVSETKRVRVENAYLLFYERRLE